MKHTRRAIQKETAIELPIHRRFFFFFLDALGDANKNT